VLGLSVDQFRFVLRKRVASLTTATSERLGPRVEFEEERSDDITALDVSEHDPLRLTSKTWRQFIHKV
jgi:hypothetical protein